MVSEVKSFHSQLQLIYLQGWVYFYLIKKNYNKDQEYYFLSISMQDQFSIAKLRNRQQLKITDESLPTVLSKSYRNTSQVSDLLHPPTQSTRNHNFHLTRYHNPITQQSVSLQIPRNKDSESFSKGKMNNITNEHQKWLQVNKKFSKPYSDCTKYIDNLSMHKALIRRGPFDIPVNKQGLIDKETTSDVKNSRNDTDKQSRNYYVSNNFSRLKSASYSVNGGSQYQYKSIFKTKKDMIFKSLNNLKNIDQQNKPRASKSINHFDRSVKNTEKNYEFLMKQQRNLKVDNVVLKNSANKLIAVDMIKQKLQENSLLTKNNLRKIQLKFQKKPEIKVHSSN